MRGSKKRLAIIKLLDNDYLETGLIAKKAGLKNNETTRKAIGAINKQAMYKLKLKQNLITSNPGSGYHINDLYMLVKE